MADFLDLLDQASKIVERTYPGSYFYEADGKPSKGTASTEPDVDTWRFVFLGPKQNQRTTTVFLEYQANAFGAPVVDNRPFLGDFIIQLPLGMGLTKAIDLKNGAGYTGAFDSVTLRWPLSPGNAEPFYIFRDVATSHFIFVGSKTGKVSQCSLAGLAV